jgi:hypothetical protein
MSPKQFEKEIEKIISKYPGMEKNTIGYEITSPKFGKVNFSYNTSKSGRENFYSLFMNLRTASLYQYNHFFDCLDQDYEKKQILNNGKCNIHTYDFDGVLFAIDTRLSVLTLENDDDTIINFITKYMEISDQKKYWNGERSDVYFGGGDVVIYHPYDGTNQKFTYFDFLSNVEKSKNKVPGYKLENLRITKVD